MRPIQNPTQPDQWMLNENQLAQNVHDEAVCSGACPIHRPSDHHMVRWPMRINTAPSIRSVDNRGRMERMCEHEVWHPDPDNLPQATTRHDCCPETCCAP